MEGKIKQEDNKYVKNEPNTKQEIKDKHHVCTTVKRENNVIDKKDDFFLTSPSPNKKLNKVAYMVINREEMNIAYQDLTSWFPIWLERGNEYIMIGYHYDRDTPYETERQDP